MGGAEKKNNGESEERERGEGKREEEEYGGKRGNGETNPNWCIMCRYCAKTASLAVLGHTRSQRSKSTVTCSRTDESRAASVPVGVADEAATAAAFCSSLVAERARRSVSHFCSCLRTAALAGRILLTVSNELETA